MHAMYLAYLWSFSRVTWLSHVATRNFKLANSFGAALAEIMVILRSTLNAMPVPQRLNASHPTLTTHVSVATLHPCPPATLGVGTRPLHGLY